MSALGRAKDVVVAQFNALIDRAEDPEKMVRQVIRNVEGEIDGVTKAVGTAIANQKRIERQLTDRRTSEMRYKQEAKAAVIREDDDAARAALAQQRHQIAEIEKMEGLLQTSLDSVNQLRGELTQLRYRLEELRLKQNELNIRQATAKSRSAVAQTVRGMGSPTNGFSKMEDEVLAAEAQAEAQAEVASLDMSPVPEISPEVEEDLVALKEEMGADKE